MQVPMTTPTSVSAVRPLRRSRLRADRLISSEIFIAVLCFQRGQCLGLLALAYHDHDDHDHDHCAADTDEHQTGIPVCSGWTSSIDGS